MVWGTTASFHVFFKSSNSYYSHQNYPGECSVEGLMVVFFFLCLLRIQSGLSGRKPPQTKLTLFVCRTSVFIGQVFLDPDGDEGW